MSSGRKKFSVLVGAVDADLQFLLRMALSEINEHIEVNFVFEGEQVLHYLLKDQLERELNRQSLPQLIIGQYKEPIFGERTLRELRSYEKFYSIPVYMLDAAFTEERRLALQTSGANEVVQLPHTYFELKRLIEKIVHKHQPKRLTQKLFCCRCDEYLEFDPNWGALAGHIPVSEEEQAFISERFEGPLCAPCLLQLKTSYRIISGKIDGEQIHLHRN